ncbi:MAG: hypothetical protein IPP59_17280 [Betaproteobacteria bacterium]|nr:hypothetical protein [Candidatus Dechloromonas phosphorivorans]
MEISSSRYCDGRRIIIGHPDRQHSHHLASGLFKANLLYKYFCGQFNQHQVAAFPAWLIQLFPKAIIRNAVPFLGESIHKALPFGAAINLISRRSPLSLLKLWGEWAGFSIFDTQLASMIELMSPDVVIAYEMSAFKTFKAAKKKNIVCILDAAACHYRLQDERLNITKSEADSMPARLIRARKDIEVSLADKIICPSRLSADSYLAAGVPENKIVVNTLGVDSAVFEAASRIFREGTPRFVFIANSAFVKGADFVSAAIADLRKHNIPAIIDVVGAVRLDVVSSGSYPDSKSWVPSARSSGSGFEQGRLPFASITFRIFRHGGS